MATLVLTAVGSLVGGPIGGALGALLGQQVDQRLFAPKARQGPRLGDLSVQTSTYGASIPKIFGRMRVAGTVVWSTDLIETRSTSGGGKGRPKTTTYSYSASFAVALSARPILAVRRIWADGKLLRGAAGDFKAKTQFRFYAGDEDQDVDPLIASAEGVGKAPAFRGIAYAMFEDFQLEDFGNRIPSLSFEVEADAGAVSVGAIAGVLSGGVVAAGATPALEGYAASGESVRAAIEALSDVVPLSLAEREGQLRLSVGTEPSLALPQAAESGRREIVRRAATSVPAEVSIAYYEPGRDFQTGLQRAGTGAGDLRNADRRALPASLSAEAAKGLAEYRLAWLRAGRTTAKLSLGWAQAALRPGDHLRLEGEAGLWRVRRWTLGSMTLTLELTQVIPGTLPAPPAAPGRGVQEPDQPHGPTVLRLFDLPLADGPATAPVLLAAAAGTSSGWRRAALAASFDGGTTWRGSATTAAPATMGAALTMLAPGGAALFDRASAVDVELLHEGMWLENASDEALAGGANLALLGNELVQFGAAQWLGGRRFRLSRLLRGRRGTEWASGLHVSGEPFTLLSADSLAAIEATAASLGGTALVQATGVGDAVPASATVPIRGEALLPPMPVHLRAQRLANGDIVIRWVRRSRLGWSWISGSETPLGEETEKYRLTFSTNDFERILDVSLPEHLYSAAQQAADEAAGPIAISVVQIGVRGTSRPATIVLS